MSVDDDIEGNGYRTLAHGSENGKTEIHGHSKGLQTPEKLNSTEILYKRQADR